MFSGTVTVLYIDTSFDLGCRSQEGNRFAGKEEFLQQLTALAKQGVHPLEVRVGDCRQIPQLAGSS